jgi:hypothetical protein
MTQKIRPVILLCCSVVLLCCFTLVFVYKLYLYDDDNNHNPLLFSSYFHASYYQINPETMLDELDQGKSDVFIPVSEKVFYDIYGSVEPKYPDIHWSQAEYLKIVNTLSREVWHEPLDSKKWNVLVLEMMQNCVDNPQGFYNFEIIYFKNSSFGFLDRQYPVRRVEVISRDGLVRWGDKTFSDAILPGWYKVTLNDLKVTADDVLSIAESNGGSTARRQHNNECTISIRLNNYPRVEANTNNNWLVDYDSTDFSDIFQIWINPLSGKIQE